MHTSFCNTLEQLLRTLRRAQQRAPKPAMAAPTVDEIRDEVLRALDLRPRYAFNTKKRSKKWHKLDREFEGETPLHMRARCGFKCGESTTAELYRTLGEGARCGQCFKKDDAEDK